MILGLKNSTSSGRTCWKLVPAVLCFAVSGSASDKEFIVANNGAANFATVQAAVDAATNGATIRIKPGHFHERIDVPAAKKALRFVGDGATNTILEFDLHANLPGPDGKPIGTGKTAATTVSADDFSAENITFENPATNAQAVAISVFGDRVSFRNCRFIGWQDTVYLHAKRQYFTNCFIAGRVDFIFGGATAFFDRCEIRCLGNGFITAASTPQEQKSGFVFSHCKITAAESVERVFLGRPWRPFASVAFLECELPSAISPDGWDNWRNPANEKTARFSEFRNYGAGTNPLKRVLWSRQLGEAEARELSLEKGWGNWTPVKK
jgi:pectinesterase